MLKCAQMFNILLPIYIYTSIAQTKRVAQCKIVKVEVWQKACCSGDDILHITATSFWNIKLVYVMRNIKI